MLFNVYDAKNAQAQRQLYKRRFTTSSAEEWILMDMEGVDPAGSNFDFNGMFRYAGKAYAMDKNAIVYQIMWNEKDQIEFKKMVSLHLLISLRVT